ncbi:MAG: hypothetical protein ACPG51_03360 [Thiolinea sp.]
MKTLLSIITFSSTLLIATPIFAGNFSGDFVNEKINQHWELGILEITQRIDVKKRREMENKSVDVAENDLQAFETQLKELIQQDNNSDINENALLSLLNGFSSKESDAQLLTITENPNTQLPDQNGPMPAGFADQEDALMVEESFTLKPDGSIIYPDSETTEGAEQRQGTEDKGLATWSFNEDKQRLIMKEQQDNLSLTASYKLIELTEKHMVLEEKQQNSSVRMIFSSK